MSFANNYLDLIYVKREIETYGYNFCIRCKLYFNFLICNRMLF